VLSVEELSMLGGAAEAISSDAQTEAV